MSERAPVRRDTRLLADDERPPRAPAGYRTLAIGLTAHLRREATWSPALCGVVPGLSAMGPPIGVCLTCAELAR